MDRFIINGDGTVTDTAMGLMWDRKTYGRMSWRDAMEFCRSITTADYSDWRLPTLYELASLVDLTSHPTIDTKAFPDTKPMGYWSSSTYADYPEVAWRVDFYDGSVYSLDKSYGYYVRAVRNGGPKDGTIHHQQ